MTNQTLQFTEKNMETYHILSGEGEGQGTWETVHTTKAGILARLKTERCGGDRWAKAFGDVYATGGRGYVGSNVETGEDDYVPAKVANPLLFVAEGILDSAAEEHLESNLADVDAVGRYAFDGCDIPLTEAECQRVLDACRNYLAQSDSGQGITYDTLIIEALELKPSGGDDD